LTVLEERRPHAAWRSTTDRQSAAPAIFPPPARPATETQDLAVKPASHCRRPVAGVASDGAWSGNRSRRDSASRRHGRRQIEVGHKPRLAGVNVPCLASVLLVAGDTHAWTHAITDPRLASLCEGCSVGRLDAHLRVPGDSATCSSLQVRGRRVAQTLEKILRPARRPRSGVSTGLRRASSACGCDKSTGCDGRANLNTRKPVGGACVKGETIGRYPSSSLTQRHHHEVNVSLGF
jgi:hypothetical protein